MCDALKVKQLVAVYLGFDIYRYLRIMHCFKLNKRQVFYLRYDFTAMPLIWAIKNLPSQRHHIRCQFLILLTWTDNSELPTVFNQRDEYLSYMNIMIFMHLSCCIVYMHLSCCIVYMHLSCCLFTNTCTCTM